jgi:hypothetical protein
MNIEVTVSTFAQVTGERTHQSRTVPEEALSATVNDILSSHCNHYATTPAEERPVVEIRIEFEPNQCRD